MKIIIVGGVAGGASAATRARRLDESAEIILVERGPDVSFANCGLPYYLGGEIQERQKLLVVTPERMKERYRLDVRTRSQVESINRTAKTVSIRDLASGRTYEESYDRLILSPGASPLKPPLPGIEHPVVQTLRNLEDTDRIKKLLQRGIKRAVVVGAGFIGLEMAEALVHQGIATSLVELQDQVLPPLDKELTTPIARTLKQRSIQLYLQHSVTRFHTIDDHSVEVELQNGMRLPAELVILSIGVRPENQLAQSAGLEIGPRGGIRVNAQLQTSDLYIYAVGDAIETRDALTSDPTQVPLAGPANRQGRLAADHLFGRTVRFRGVQGTSIVRVFDMTAALTGATEKVLLRRQQPFSKIYLHPAHHAGYFPGAEGMTLKVLFAPDTGKLLGAEAVGGAGVDKRIDILSVAMQAGMTVFDLEEMELAYAPPYGSAKDPINMAGFIGAGLVRGDHPQVHVSDYLALPAASRPLTVDVRLASEFAQGNLPGALHIPVDELRGRLQELPRQPIVVYCQVGMRGYLATRILLQAGYDVKNLSGGYRTWQLYHDDQASK
ncbi:MAG: FAD-dependent oxidoreductase [Gemmatales bacterium]